MQETKEDVVVSALSVALTPEGMRALHDELLTLSDRRESLTTSVDGQADQEAGSYFHDELALLERRIAEVRTVLARAVPLGEADREPGVVAVGSRVTVRWKDDGDESYTIVDPAEASQRTGRISFESPVGQALMGRRAGMSVTVMAAGGISELEIVTVT